MKEFDSFFRDQLAIFRLNFVQNCGFCFSSKMLNFAISFVFCPERISCVRTDWCRFTCKNFHYNGLCVGTCCRGELLNIQCESKKIPEIFWHFFPNGWEFLVQILRAYYTFLSTLDIFIQLPATLTKLCHIKRDHHHTLKMSTIAWNAR